MDGLKRKILYNKSSSDVKDRLHEFGKTGKPIITDTPIIFTAPGVIAWLKDHPLINMAALAAVCGIDKGNLARWIKAGEIPAKHEKTVIEVLKQYGYDQGK